MRIAFPCLAAFIPVSSLAGLHLAGLSAGGAGKAEKAEGKIKEDGTMSGRFRKLLLSAHWLGEPRAAPCFWASRAAISRKALAFLGFERHHGRRLPVFLRFWTEQRP